MRKYRKKTIAISNFSSSQNSDDNCVNLEIEIPAKCYNLKSEKGKLISGNGFSHLTLPFGQDKTTDVNFFELNPLPQSLTFSKIWHYKYYSEFNGRYDYLLVAFGSDNNLYFHNIFTPDLDFNPIGVSFNEEPVALNFIVEGAEVIGFSSTQDDFLVWFCDEIPYTVPTAPKFISICLHKQRLFVIDSKNDNLVRFSAKTNPTEWTTSNDDAGAGTIEMNDYKGELKTLLSFGDYVYVFRDFGISKITSYSSESVYYASNVYTSSHKIHCSTACICEDKIYFLQEDGLYEFDGSNVKMVPLKISNMIRDSFQNGANTCFYNKKLYIACNLNYDDGESVGCENGEFTNNCLVEFSPETKEYSITRGVDIAHMLPIKDLFVDKLVVLQKGSNYLWQVDNSGGDLLSLKKNFSSGKITLGDVYKEKILKEISINCDCDCKIIVKSERASKTFSIVKSGKPSRLVCNMAGKEFSFEIESSEKSIEINDFKATFNEED